MVTQLNDCFSLPLKTGCIIIGIIYGLLNIASIVGLSVKAVQAQYEYEKKTHTRVMESSFVILAILNISMFLIDLGLIIGAVKETAYLLYSWVIMYTVLMIMTTLAYLAVAIICVFLPPCKTVLAITVVSAGWISFSIYCFCVLVVYSYFKLLYVWPDQGSNPSNVG